MKITTSIRIGVLSVGIIALCLARMSPSESHLKSKAMKLVNDHGSCSGEQVKAPSGVSYILTAAHCKALEDASGQIKVETEDGRKLSRKVIVEDEQNDLLLLEGVPGMEGLEVAEESALYDPVRTFTHGRGMNTYKTEGSRLQPLHIDIPLARVETDEDAAKCVMPKDKIININTDFFSVRVCVISIDVDVMTASVIPGSSGGMVVDNAGRLVGVVSATDGAFGFAVPLKDIKRFLANY